MKDEYPPPRSRYSIETRDPETGERLAFSVSCESEPSPEMVEAFRALAIAASKAIREGTLEDEAYT